MNVVTDANLILREHSLAAEQLYAEWCAMYLELSKGDVTRREIVSAMQAVKDEYEAVAGRPICSERVLAYVEGRL